MKQLNYRLRPNQPAGFTIVELMIATVVFSVILLVVTAGVLSFTHQYYKGITSNETQTVARTIANQIAQDLQFSNSYQPETIDATSDSIRSFCIGSDVYTFRLGGQLAATTNVTNDQYPNGLVVYSSSSCTPPASPEAAASNDGARELLAANMRLASLSIESIGSNAYSVSVKVIYGDNDLLTPAIVHPTDPSTWASESCSNQNGEDFCATAQLSTTVTPRLQSVN